MCQDTFHGHSRAFAFPCPAVFPQAVVKLVPSPGNATALSSTGDVLLSHCLAECFHVFFPGSSQRMTNIPCFVLISNLFCHRKLLLLQRKRFQAQEECETLA